jgi:hypothetical protein
MVLPVAAQQPCVPTLTTNPTQQITWEAPLPQPGVTLAGYVLEYKKDEGNWQPLPAPPLAATSAMHSGLTPGTYTWRLSATMRLSSGQTATTGYAPAGVKQPCRTVVVLNPPLNLQVTDGP